MNKEKLRENIRLNLIALRVKKGITQADLAAELNKGKTTIASWEQGLSLPDVTTLYELSKFYRVDMDYFYNENESIKQIERLEKYSQLLNKQREKVTK